MNNFLDKNTQIILVLQSSLVVSAFLEFEKVFDTGDSAFLWLKLFELNIN